MEIRLLVNGNLVHTMTMANLSLITAKRDIYFATTAPEFIQRDLRIRGSETDEDAAAAAEQSEAGPYAGRPRLLVDELPPLVTTVASRPEHCIQRARSLQKPRASMLAGSSNSSMDRRNISKSVSCTEAYVATDAAEHERRGGSPTAAAAARLSANDGTAGPPPNTPRISSCNSSESSVQPASPGRGGRLVGGGSRLALRSSSSPFHSYHGDMNAGSNSSSSGSAGAADKVKPLRIFRIPLSNLIGNHAHPYHMRSASVTRASTSSTGSSSAGSSSAKTAVQLPAVVAPAKIVEEQQQQQQATAATSQSSAQRPRTPQAGPAAAAATSQSPSDRIGVKRDKFNELSFNYGCTEPLFTSL